VDFFNNLAETNLKVLDIGCGQGRDALFIARLGHSVTAVDLSPSGIADLQRDSDIENLDITAEVADVCYYDIQSDFDVIVVDRTLHMLSPEARITVLKKILTASKKGAYILIADERSNLPAFKTTIADSARGWTFALERKGFLFILSE